MNNKDIEYFKKNGFLIKKSISTKTIELLQKKVINLILKSKKNLVEIKKKYRNNQLFLSNLHKHIKLNEINEIRVKIINGFNKDRSFRESYYLAAKELLDLIVGNELAMQNKINLSVQMPKDKKSVLPMHSDVYAGESPFEVVVWIPLMNIEANTQSMFIANIKDNKFINKEITNSKKKTILEIYNSYKKKFRFIKINYDEILIFTPVVMHGNTVNNTKSTRVSLNCRFKSLLSPYDVFSKTHRNIPHFYSPLNIKPMTKIGFNFIEQVNINKFKINKKF